MNEWPISSLKLLFDGSCLRRFWTIVSAFILTSGYGLAQHNNRAFYLEIHVAPQSSFGPSENQAEIKGGYDPNSYDELEHLSIGFQYTTATELVFGYLQNGWLLQSTICYFSQDMGLINKPAASSNGPSLAMADLMSARISAQLQLSNSEKVGPHGLYSGFFIGVVFPFSYDIDKQAKINYGIEDISHSVQFCWGIDFSYSLRLGTSGFYMIAGTSLTMPGLIGGIGKIKLEDDSSYTLVRSDIRMYTIKGFIGVGYRLGKGK